METYVGSGDIAPCNFNLRVRPKWSDSRPGRFNPNTHSNLDGSPEPVRSLVMPSLWRE